MDIQRASQKHVCSPARPPAPVLVQPRVARWRRRRGHDIAAFPRSLTTKAQKESNFHHHRDIIILRPRVGSIYNVRITPPPLASLRIEPSHFAIIVDAY